MPGKSKDLSSGKMAGGPHGVTSRSASNFSKAVPFLAALEQQLYQPITPRNSVNVRIAQADKATSMAREQQADETEDGDGESVADNYFDVPYEADSARRQVHEAEEEGKQNEEPSPEILQRRRSVTEACNFLRDFMESRWPDQLHAGYIKIQCNLVMDEIKEFGRLDKTEGPKECRRLVSAPVIHDAIGYALWSEMANEMVKTGESPGDNTMALTAALTDTSLATVAMQEKAHDELAARRARSMRRRATEGDAITAQSVPRSASAHSATSTGARARRMSDTPMLRPDKVVCAMCGSRAMLDCRSDEERKRGSISRRLSVKMNKTLAKFGEGLAAGYGGNGVSRVTDSMAG